MSYDNDPGGHLEVSRAEIMKSKANDDEDPGISKNAAAYALIFNRENWTSLQEAAQRLASAKIRGAKTAEQVIAKALVGVELDIGLMRALRGIDLIETNEGHEIGIRGRLGLSLIQQRAIPLGAICETKIEENDRCTWIMARPGKEPKEYSYSMEDAERQGLAGKTTYKKWTREMCRWRAFALGSGVEFADILQGCYIAEELTHYNNEQKNARGRRDDIDDDDNRQIDDLDRPSRQISVSPNPAPALPPAQPTPVPSEPPGLTPEQDRAKKSFKAFSNMKFRSMDTTMKPDDYMKGLWKHMCEEHPVLSSAFDKRVKKFSELTMPEAAAVETVCNEAVVAMLQSGISTEAPA